MSTMRNLADQLTAQHAKQMLSIRDNIFFQKMLQDKLGMGTVGDMLRTGVLSQIDRSQKLANAYRNATGSGKFQGYNESTISLTYPNVVYVKDCQDIDAFIAGSVPTEDDQELKITSFIHDIFASSTKPFTLTPAIISYENGATATLNTADDEDNIIQNLDDRITGGASTVKCFPTMRSKLTGVDTNGQFHSLECQIDVTKQMQQAVIQHYRETRRGDTTYSYDFLIVVNGAYTQSIDLKNLQRGSMHNVRSKLSSKI